MQRRADEHLRPGRIDGPRAGARNAAEIDGFLEGGGEAARDAVLDGAGPQVWAQSRLELVQAVASGRAARTGGQRPPLQQLEVDPAVARAGSRRRLRARTLALAGRRQRRERDGAAVGMRPHGVHSIV
jgi:hypothetical protein